MRDQLNGILVLDKPAGISSARAVADVKKVLNCAKVGHTGTLDPFATGVLICCLNQATRLARFFLHGDKGYEAVLHLGTATDTQDNTGQVVTQNPVPPLSADDLAAVFARFEGRQMQQPPVYAALKHQGVPLYRLARQGKPVTKAPRPVTISALRIQDVTLPQVRFTVTCSAGTYIRTLCHDIGQMLGCGGHLAQLRRTASSGFAIEEALSLDRLRAVAAAGNWHHLIVPMAEALRGMSVFEAEAGLLEQIAQGRTLSPLEMPPAAIRGGNGEPVTDPIKVVDGTGVLKAVVQRAAIGDSYNYCCVFN